MNDVDKKEVRKRIIHLIKEAENDEIYDVKYGLYSLYEYLGGRVGRDEWGDWYLIDREAGNA